jgi:hypothetical protein
MRADHPNTRTLRLAGSKAGADYLELQRYLFLLASGGRRRN